MRERSGEWLPETMLIMGSPEEQTPAHPDEIYLKAGEMIHIGPERPLPYFPPSEHSVLALISLPTHREFTDNATVALGFNSKYVLTRKRLSSSEHAYGLGLYDDTTQTFRPPLTLPPTVEWLSFGRQHLRMMVRTEQGPPVIQTISGAHPTVHALIGRVGGLTTRDAHFTLTLQPDKVTLTDSSKHGTRVLAMP